MGDRYILRIECPICGHLDDAYYAPTCNIVTWTCSECGQVVELKEYTNISYEEASNRETIEKIAEIVKYDK